ncbi:protein of unknown function [Pararobbsia alpina]
MAVCRDAAPEAFSAIAFAGAALACPDTTADTRAESKSAAVVLDLSETKADPRSGDDILRKLT